jgi:hypothetical protein
MALNRDHFSLGEGWRTDDGRGYLPAGKPHRVGPDSTRSRTNLDPDDPAMPHWRGVLAGQRLLQELTPPALARARALDDTHDAIAVRQGRASASAAREADPEAPPLLAPAEGSRQGADILRIIQEQQDSPTAKAAASLPRAPPEAWPFADFPRALSLSPRPGRAASPGPAREAAAATWAAREESTLPQQESERRAFARLREQIEAAQREAQAERPGTHAHAGEGGRFHARAGGERHRSARSHARSSGGGGDRHHPSHPHARSSGGGEDRQPSPSRPRARHPRAQTTRGGGGPASAHRSARSHARSSGGGGDRHHPSHPHARSSGGGEDRQPSPSRPRARHPRAQTARGGGGHAIGAPHLEDHPFTLHGHPMYVGSPYPFAGVVPGPSVAPPPATHPQELLSRPYTPDPWGDD